MIEDKKDKPTERLIALLSPLVEPLGYEIVYVEVQTHRQKVLRVFIDHLGDSNQVAIGVEDCAKVSRALDEPLETLGEVEAVFRGAYDLEVSSPGVERPLRLARDYSRFQGQNARIHVFRPLTAEEMGNPGYHSKNPKQKNFLGVIQGVESDPSGTERVKLDLSSADEAPKGKARKLSKKAVSAQETEGSSEAVVTVPISLISKAHLEPHFDFEQLLGRTDA